MHCSVSETLRSFNAMAESETALPLLMLNCIFDACMVCWMMDCFYSMPATSHHPLSLSIIGLSLTASDRFLMQYHSSAKWELQCFRHEAESRMAFSWSRYLGQCTVLHSSTPEWTVKMFMQLTNCCGKFCFSTCNRSVMYVHTFDTDDCVVCQRMKSCLSSSERNEEEWYSAYSDDSRRRMVWTSLDQEENASTISRETAHELLQPCIDLGRCSSETRLQTAEKAVKARAITDFSCQT